MLTASCFFIGHHDAGEEIISVLAAEIERHITEYGVKVFAVGRYGNFDRMAVRMLVEAKRQYPEITLQLLVPYHPFNRSIEVPDGFDGLFYPPGIELVPKKYAISKANRYMIRNSTHLIAYAYHTMGGAGKLMKYARTFEKKGMLHVENLAEKIERY